MIINKVEERKPAAIPQPLWTTPPPENRWDELAKALAPAEPQTVGKALDAIEASMKPQDIDAIKRGDVDPTTLNAADFDVWLAARKAEIKERYSDWTEAQLQEKYLRMTNQEDRLADPSDPFANLARTNTGVNTEMALGDAEYTFEDWLAEKIEESAAEEEDAGWATVARWMVGGPTKMQPIPPTLTKAEMLQYCFDFIQRVSLTTDYSPESLNTEYQNGGILRIVELVIAVDKANPIVSWSVESEYRESDYEDLEAIDEADIVIDGRLVGSCTTKEKTIMDGLLEIDENYDDQNMMTTDDTWMVLHEIARGRTMPHDTLTPELARAIYGLRVAYPAPENQFAMSNPPAIENILYTPGAAEKLLLTLGYEKSDDGEWVNSREAGIERYLNALDTVAYYYGVGYTDHHDRERLFGTLEEAEAMELEIKTETKEQREDRLIHLGCPCAADLIKLREKRLTVSPAEAEKLDLEFGEKHGYPNMLIMRREDRIRLKCPMTSDEDLAIHSEEHEAEKEANEEVFEKWYPDWSPEQRQTALNEAQLELDQEHNNE
jgi:hypothetical protein